MAVHCIYIFSLQDAVKFCRISWLWVVLAWQTGGVFQCLAIYGAPDNLEIFKYLFNHNIQIMGRA